MERVYFECDGKVVAFAVSAASPKLTCAYIVAPKSGSCASALKRWLLVGGYEVLDQGADYVADGDVGFLDALRIA